MCQIEPSLYLYNLLLIGVVRLGGHEGIVADPVETRNAAAIEDHAGIERPCFLARAPDLILRIEIAFDALFDAPDARPLFVSRRIAVDASVRADTEIGVVKNVGRDDAVDFVIVIGAQPRRNESHRDAAVRVDADFGYRNEGCGRRVEPPRD